MSYLISKPVGYFRYYLRFQRSKTGALYIYLEGLKNNGTSFGDKSLAEDHLDMALSEMKQSDNSKLEIIKI